VSTVVEQSPADNDATPQELLRPAQVPAEADSPPSGPVLRPLLRGAVLAIVLLAAVLLVYGTIVSTLIFDQRQDHLGSAAKSPTPSLAFGDASLTLQIPDLSMNLTTIEGVTVDHLRGGPAREPTGALPGDAGVMLVYGHREAYGAPFEHLDRVAKGTAIYTQARNGPVIKYQVTDVLRRTAIAEWKVPADTTDLSYLLLVTSEGGWFQHDQIVVIAKSLPVSQTPARIADLSTGEMSGRAWIAHFGLAVVALLGAVGSWRFLRGRAGNGVRLTAIGAMAVLAIVEVLMALDSLLPLVR
jgi:LPXTG-site transpeptidase (sortase) family protein